MTTFVPEWRPRRQADPESTPDFPLKRAPGPLCAQAQALLDEWKRRAKYVEDIRDAEAARESEIKALEDEYRAESTRAADECVVGTRDQELLVKIQSSRSRAAWVLKASGSSS